MDMMRMAYRFIHGGIMRVTHCGRMMRHTCCRRVKASDSAASHWPGEMDSMAPRTISATFAITGRARPTTAFCQPGNGIVRVPAWNWNGSRNVTKNSSTSQGALRKNSVTATATARSVRLGETSQRPSTRPSSVPIDIDSTLIMTLKANPRRRSGVQRSSTASVPACTGPSAALAATPSMIIATGRTA